jgi:rubrerythrin
MLNSKDWWNKVRQNPELLLDWLRKQYHGEQTAYERIVEFANEYSDPASKWHPILMKIAEQERSHAAWVGELLEARGVTPQILEKEERYWNETLPGIESFESGAAVAAHAEQMRLERITEIVADPSAPEDIRAVFGKILPEEQFHAKAFASMAGGAAMEQALDRHLGGTEAIGLIPAD